MACQVFQGVHLLWILYGRESCWCAEGNALQLKGSYLRVRGVLIETRRVSFRRWPQKDLRNTCGFCVSAYADRRTCSARRGGSTRCRRRKGRHSCSATRACGSRPACGWPANDGESHYYPPRGKPLYYPSDHWPAGGRCSHHWPPHACFSVSHSSDRIRHLVLIEASEDRKSVVL